MADDIKAIFAGVKEEAKDFSTALWQCCEKIYSELPQDYEADIDPELQLAFLTDKLNQAVSTLCDGLDNPTLILATTGTTSSGKSSLVNLLCGAELMPRAVLERSAGVVTVEYSEQRAVKIEETGGATWECGTWHNVSNEDIYDRLNGVMKAYLKHKAAGDSHVACPQSTVYYPFRLVAEPSLLDLPEGTTVKIMDLPGLAHVGDEGNAEVIRRSKEALCLVTYNSAETDEVKVASLLKEVVEQVKELGGSPARMLFILNRIDVFRDGKKDWPEDEKMFFDKTSQDIRSKLKESLGEYNQEIDNAKIIKLSSLPALLALKIIDGSDAEKNEAADALDSHFNFLIPEDVLDDLPRNVRKWTNHDQKRISEVVWKEANAEAFHQHLKQHILNEYPNLILPQVISKFKDSAASELVRWAAQTTSAVINSSEEKYKLECDRVEDIRSRLKKSVQDKAEALKAPFREIEKMLHCFLNGKRDIDPMTALDEKIRKLKDNSCFGKQIAERLIPLYDWDRELSKAVGEVTTPILDALQDGESVSLSNNKAFEYATTSDVSLLEELIRDLAKEGYSGYAGKKFEARTPVEKEKLRTFNQKLNNLSYVLKSIINDVAEKVIDREMVRVKDAIKNLFVFHLESIQQEATSISPDLAISFPQTKLTEVSFKAEPKFLFESGFPPITEETYTENVTKKTGTKRVWLFFKKDVYTNMAEKRSSDNANIPSSNDLGRGWNLQKQRGEVDVFKVISFWWLEQFDQFYWDVEKFQADVIDEYKTRLDRAYQDNRVDYESQMEIWQPLKEEGDLIAAQINQLGAEWKNRQQASKHQAFLSHT